MDLRDQIAIAAMQGFISVEWKDRQRISESAYEQADAMIAEREKGSVDNLTDAKAQLIRAIELEHEIHVHSHSIEHLCIKHLIHYLRTGFRPEEGEV